MASQEQTLPDQSAPTMEAAAPVPPQGPPANRMSRGRGTYLPPRMRSSGQHAAGGPRSLEELAPQSMKIKIEFTQGSPFNFDLCPDNFVEEVPEGDGTPSQQAGAAYPQTDTAAPDSNAAPAAGADTAITPHKPLETLESAACVTATSEPSSKAPNVALGDAIDSVAAPAKDPEAAASSTSTPAGNQSGAAANDDAAPPAAATPTQAAGPGEAAAVTNDAAGVEVKARQKAPLECRYLSSPACPDTYQIKQLLRWFKEACRETSEDFPKGDKRAVLSLPASLSKRERAHWHQEADRLALNSQSTGFGEQRFLQIRPTGNYQKQSWGWNAPQGHPSSSSHRQGHVAGLRPHHPHAAHAPVGAVDAAGLEPPGTDEGHLPHTQTQDACAAAARPQHNGDDAAVFEPGQPREGTRGQERQHWQQDRQQQWGRGGRGSGVSRRPPDLAKQLWDWCQLEGGALWNYSQGEIKDALAAVGGDADKLPPELAALVAKRRVSLRLAAALQSRDEGTACQLLEQCEPSTRLGWVRDPDSGGYPAHIAAWHGLGAFLHQLIDRDGVDVLQQHDASRSTPIHQARQRGHIELAAALEQQHVAARGTSSSTPDVPPAPGERGFATTAEAAASVEGAGAQEESASAPVTGPSGGDGLSASLSVGPGRGFARGGFGRGRGRGGSTVLPHATGEAAPAAGGQEAPAAQPAADSGPDAASAVAVADAAPPPPSTTAAAASPGNDVKEAASKAADAPSAGNSQQQVQSPDELAPTPAQAAPPAAEVGLTSSSVAGVSQPSSATEPASDIYCSYSSRDNRAFTLYGRGPRFGGGQHRGRGGGRWSGRGSWHGGGRGGRYGGRHGGGRGRVGQNGGEGAGDQQGQQPEQ